MERVVLMNARALTLYVWQVIKGRRLPPSVSSLEIIEEHVKSCRWTWLLPLCLVGGCQPCSSGGGWVGVCIHVRGGVGMALTQFSCLGPLSLILGGEG